MDKTSAFIELYQLLIYYSENRDRPAPEGFNFVSELNTYCEALELDRKEIEKHFNLKYFES